MGAPMELTNIYLRSTQKKALQQRAKANGTNVAEEVRSAVDAYLSGITADEIELLDAATKHTAALFAEMNAMADAMNRKSTRIFAEMAKLRGGYPEGAT